MKLTYNDDCHSIDCSMIFLNMKICSVVPLPGRKPACSFLSFDSTPVRLLLITILPRTLLTTDNSVIPRQCLHSFRFPLFDRQFDNQSFPPFSWCLLVSPHNAYDLLDFISSIVNVRFKRLRLYVVYSWCFSILQMSYGLPYFSSAGFRCINRQFYLHFTYWITRLSIFSTSEKCSNNRLNLLSLSLRILPVLQHSALVFRCLILWSGYTVFSCVIVQPHFQLLLQSLQSIFSYSL